MTQYTFKSPRLELVYMSFIEAEKITPKSSWALISVCDPAVEPSIRYEQWSYCLRLAFEDVSSPEDGLMFSEAMAGRLIEFALNLPVSVDRLFVHCTVGVSRSPAVVRFLARYVYPECLNEDFNRDYLAYNRTVYKILVKAWKKNNASVNTPSKLGETK